MKSRVKSGKVTQLEMNSLRRDATELIRELLEYSQRVNLTPIEKEVLEVNFGDKKGELVLTDAGNFFIESGRIMQIVGNSFKLSDNIALEKAITTHKNKKEKTSVKISSSVLSALSKELGEFEIVL